MLPPAIACVGQNQQRSRWQRDPGVCLFFVPLNLGGIFASTPGAEFSKPKLFLQVHNFLVEEKLRDL